MTRRASFTDNHPHPSSARFVSASHAVIDGDPHSALTAFVRAQPLRYRTMKQRELLSPAGRPERQGSMRLELMRSVETQLRAEDDATRKRFAESLGLVYDPEAEFEDTGDDWEDKRQARLVADYLEWAKQHNGVFSGQAHPASHRDARPSEKRY